MLRHILIINFEQHSNIFNDHRSYLKIKNKKFKNISIFNDHKSCKITITIVSFVSKRNNARKELLKKIVFGINYNNKIHINHRLIYLI